MLSSLLPLSGEVKNANQLNHWFLFMPIASQYQQITSATLNNQGFAQIVTGCFSPETFRLLTMSSRRFLSEWGD
jgi:hypothetical protein